MSEVYFTARPLADVRHERLSRDTDDGMERPRAAIHAHALADRILVWPRGTREVFAHDCDEWRALRVRIGEVAPEHQRESESMEILRTNGGHEHLHALSTPSRIRGARRALRRRFAAEVTLRERHLIRERDGLDSRQTQGTVMNGAEKTERARFVVSLA